MTNMIAFKYGMSAEEWHKWNNQPHVQEYKKELEKLQKEQMKERGEILVEKLAYGFQRTFIVKKNDQVTLEKIKDMPA